MRLFVRHLIVIPTYNEYNNIERIISEIFSKYENISILVVDDSSPDNTGELVKKLQQQYKNLYLLSRKEKEGLSTAYINGFKWGIEKGFDLFTTCDADFSHNPKFIKDAVAIINEGYDVASGSRYIKGGNTNEKHWFRNLISIGGNIYARIILGFEFVDWLEGFNTFTLKTLENINLDEVNAKGFIFQAEMKYRAVKKGCKVKEFPIFFEVRKEGESKMTANIIIEALLQILKMKFRLK